MRPLIVRSLLLEVRQDRVLWIKGESARARWSNEPERRFTLSADNIARINPNYQIVCPHTGAAYEPRLFIGRHGCIARTLSGAAFHRTLGIYLVDRDAMGVVAFR